MNPNRIQGFDVARAFAVVGMVLVNYKLVMAQGDLEGPGWLRWLVGLLEGKAAATFVVLAGVGIALLSKRAWTTGDTAALARHRWSLLRRAALLFVIGLLYTPLWPADILHFYGLYIAVAVLVLGWSSRRLLTLAIAFGLGFVIMLLTLDYEKGWHWDTLAYDDLWTPVGMVRHLFFNGFHPVFPWTAFLLVGMVLGRLDWRSVRVRWTVLLWGATCLTFAEVASHGLIGATRGAWGDELALALFGTSPMPPMPLYLLTGIGSALTVIALCVELTQRWPEAPALRPLVAMGQLALTLYVAHVVIGMGTLEALGRLEGQTFGFAVLCALIFCLGGALFAWAWRRYFDRGPLEAILRRLT